MRVITIKLMKGRLGELIDKINQRLQVVVVHTEGTPAEQAGLDIADLLRDVYHEVQPETQLPRESTYEVVIKSHLTAKEIEHDLTHHLGATVLTVKQRSNGNGKENGTS